MTSPLRAGGVASLDRARFPAERSGAAGEPPIPGAMRARFLRFALPLVGATALSAQSPGIPPDIWERLEAQGARYSAVEIRIGQVFDPSRPHEDHWIGRTANALHLATRERVVAREIPFKAGDRVVARDVHQAERNLRSFRFIKEAFIDPVLDPDGRVRAVVRTQDAWTLKVSLGYSQVGGQRSFGYSVKEANLLGLGKDLTVSHDRTPERATDTVLYEDRQLLGSAWTLATQYQVLSDGRARGLEFGRPYRSLETPWSATLRLASSDTLGTVRNLRRTAFEFPSQVDRAFLEGTWAGAPRGDRVVRMGGGLDLLRIGQGPARLVDALALAEGPLAPPPEGTRRLQGFHLTWSLFEDAFQDFRDLESMSHTEDHNLGWEASLRLGRYTKVLGSQAEGTFFEAGLRKAWRPRPDVLLRTAAKAGGRREPEGWRNALASATFTAYHQGLPFLTQAAHLQVDLARRPDPEFQLHLGGMEGLRGYPNDLFLGDRRWVLSLEERPTTNLNWLGILRVGFVFYADAGAIRRLDTGRWSRTYLDVGGGLRFGDLKSSVGRLFLVTVAYPLRREPGMAASQIVIGNVVRF